MTGPEPVGGPQVSMDQYCLAFRPVLDLLASLLDCATSQEAAALAADFEALAAATERRSEAMRALEAADAPLRAAREVIARSADGLHADPLLAQIETLHRQARDFVAAVSQRDARTQSALQRLSDEARTSAQQLEVGGTTLAAYRRIVAPPLQSAELVDRRG